MKSLLAAIPACTLFALPGPLHAQPVLRDAAVSIHAVVRDPTAIAFAPDGTVYCGRDAAGSGGGNADAVKIHRISPDGSQVAEFGNVAISDPDALIVDVAGMVSGVPGAVLVGGVENNASGTGKIVRITQDGTVTLLFGPSASLNNPSGFAFQADGRLLITEYNSGRVLVTGGETPTVLFSLAQALRIAVDALDRIVVNSSGSTALRLYSAQGALLNAAFGTVLAGCPLARGPGGSWGSDIYAIAPNGDLVRFGLDGSTNQLGSGFANVTSLAFGPDNALYAAEFQADRVYRFAPPLVPGATTAVYARVTDPTRISFAPDGTAFVGRDNTGSGGDFDDAVKIHRIGPGGAPVVEYGNTPITDPDGVFFDLTGQFSGTPGAVLTAGTLLNTLSGKIDKIAPDGTVTTLYGPTAFNFNPNFLVFDEFGGRLLLGDDVGGKVWAMTNTTPAVLFNLANVSPLAVDALGRIVAGSSDNILRLYSAQGVLLNAAFAHAQTNSPLVRGPGGFWGQDVHFISTNWNLARVDSNGNVSPAGRNFGGVIGFDFGPDGALYACQLNSDLVWRLAPAPMSPSLSVSHTATNTVVVWWPSPSTDWALEQNTNGLGTVNWSNVLDTIHDDGTHKSLLVDPPVGSRVYRLRKQ